MYPQPYAPPSGTPPPVYYAPPPAYPSSVPYPSDPERPAPGAREHDGFFLRLATGFGAGGVRYRESVDGTRISNVRNAGLATLFNVSVGGRVVDNLILHADLMLSSVGKATKKVDGTRDATDRIDNTMVLLGGGITYYFMPVNVYLTAAVGLGKISEERDHESAIESGAGFASSVMLGKEWFVGRSAEWGLGAALRGSFYAAPVNVAGVKSTALGSDIGVVFSATYN